MGYNYGIGDLHVLCICNQTSDTQQCWKIATKYCVFKLYKAFDGGNIVACILLNYSLNRIKFLFVCFLQNM